MLAKSKVIGYVGKNFTTDMLFKLGETGDKCACPSEATTEERNEELLANVELSKLREDFIVAKGDKFKPDDTAKVWGYAKAAAEAKGRSLAPSESWPSDHFPMHATLALNTMTAVDRSHQGKSSRKEWGQADRNHIGGSAIPCHPAFAARVDPHDNEAEEHGHPVATPIASDCMCFSETTSTQPCIQVCATP